MVSSSFDVTCPTEGQLRSGCVGLLQGTVGRSRPLHAVGTALRGTQAVEAGIDAHPSQPCGDLVVGTVEHLVVGELRQRFLDHVLRLGTLAEDAPGEPDELGVAPAEDLSKAVGHGTFGVRYPRSSLTSTPPRGGFLHPRCNFRSPVGSDLSSNR